MKKKILKMWVAAEFKLENLEVSTHGLQMRPFNRHSDTFKTREMAEHFQQQDSKGIKALKITIEEV